MSSSRSTIMRTSQRDLKLKNPFDQNVMDINQSWKFPFIAASSSSLEFNIVIWSSFTAIYRRYNDDEKSVWQQIGRELGSDTDV